MSGAVDVAGDGSSEEEFLWTCTLTGADKEYDWSPEVTSIIAFLLT